MADLTPRTITSPDADGLAVTDAGSDDAGAWIQHLVPCGADGTPLKVLGDGSVAATIVGALP